MQVRSTLMCWLCFLGETVLIVLTICNNLPLTVQNDKSIIHFDNESCQIDKQSCRTEVLYDTAKSFKGTQGCTEC